jgi:hypothetical protein
MLRYAVTGHIMSLLAVLSALNVRDAARRSNPGRSLVM